MNLDPAWIKVEPSLPDDLKPGDELLTIRRQVIKEVFCNGHQYFSPTVELTRFYRRAEIKQ